MQYFPWNSLEKLLSEVFQKIYWLKMEQYPFLNLTFKFYFMGYNWTLDRIWKWTYFFLKSSFHWTQIVYEQSGDRAQLWLWCLTPL
jgi:hypothetical protein